MFDAVGVDCAQMVILFVWDVWKNITGWVGAVPVCPPVSHCRGAFVVHPPRTMRVFFGMETPLCGRSGGHTGTAPTVSFGQIVRGMVDFVWGELRVNGILFVWDCVEKYYGAW